MKGRRTEGGIWQLYKMGGIAPAIASVFDARNAQHMAFIRSLQKEQRKNDMFDVQLHDLEAVVFDLETTGFSPYNGDEILSIGAVAVHGKAVAKQESFYTLVKPGRCIPAHIQELTGITDAMVEDGQDLMEAIHAFFEFTQHKVLIAHASGHDKHFLNSALWKTSKTGFKHRLLDTMMITKWLHPKLGEYTLDRTLKLYGIPIRRRHHALEDAQMTAELWGKLLDDLEAQQITNLGELYIKLSHMA